MRIFSTIYACMNKKFIFPFFGICLTPRRSKEIRFIRDPNFSNVSELKGGKTRSHFLQALCSAPVLKTQLVHAVVPQMVRWFCISGHTCWLTRFKLFLIHDLAQVQGYGMFQSFIDGMFHEWAFLEWCIIYWEDIPKKNIYGRS